jgi:uncharacterized damage-inducible protein DinB
MATLAYIEQMTTKSAFADAFGHHVWATIRVVEACELLTPEQLATPVAGTYGSILDTLRHLVAADRSYLTLLDGSLPDVEEDKLDLVIMRATMHESDPVWQKVVSSPNVEQDVVRHRDDGSESHAPRGIRLAQVIHHGTDHRSQICTGLTALGFTPPDIDVWDYGRVDGRVFVSGEPVTA